MLTIRACATTLLLVIATGGANAQTATQDIVITAVVPKSCSVNNSAAGTVDAAVIAITAAGNVNTAPVTPTNSPYANVACNAPSNLQLTSLSGGVVNASTVTGFANIINYTGSATWNGVTATVNTASNPAATGSESGTAMAVSSAFSGSLSVSIAPAANTLPLVLGTYNDTLRVTLIPQ